MLTTYQTGRVIMLSSDGKDVFQLVRSFDRPMGVSFNQEMMALALRTNITFFKNCPELAKTYPKKENTYDSLYYPTAQNITSYIDVHDTTFSKQGLVAVNTAYSCLVKLDGKHSFEPIWKPNFIKEFSPIDACHLNGACIDENGNMRYVTGFGQTAEAQGWRTNKLKGGFLIDITTDKVISSGLSMPHSPRVYKGELYVLLSASEKLVKIDRGTGNTEDICEIDGFIRGLSFYENYAFIGVSKLRKSHTFGDLPIARKKLYAGVVVVDINKKEKVAELLYDGDLEEIYDVHFLPGKKRVNILNQMNIQEMPAVVTPNFEQWINREDKEENGEKDETK
jgi:uncharacterized protein (TIGR03032 family)